MTRTRRSIARALLEGDAFQARLAAVAGKAGLAPDAARRKALADFLEMVCVQSPLFGFLLDRGIGSLYTRAWSFDVDWESLDRLRQDHPDTSLVFLPTHRSYADAFVLMRALVSHRLPPTYVMGGDNLRFFPLGNIGRRAGIIFIRRSFRDDDVYKLALRTYLQHLIAAGANFEWYMEGGRSRTGKLRPPRYGLLRYFADALAETPGRDVLLVPISITYDQLQEVGAIAAEDTGGVKTREGLGWLARYIRDQGRKLGRAYVRFGVPLSLRGALSPGAGGSASTLDKVAFEVFQRINRASPLTPPSLVALVLLGAGERALSLPQVQDLLRPLLDYAAARDLPAAALDELRDARGIERVLEALAGAGVVRRHDGGLEPVFVVEPGQHAIAAYYRNSAIHWFVNRAILELGIMVAARDGAGDALARGMGAARAWRDVLKFEFFFSEKSEFDEEIAREARLLEPEIGRMVSGGTLPAGLLERSPFLVAHRVLPVYLEAYAVVAERLAAQPVAAAVDQKKFIAHCLAVGRQYVLQKRLRHPESVSRELLGNGLALAANRGLLGSDDGTLAERRQRFAAEMTAGVAAIEAIAALDARLRPGARGPG